jgi:hypothetical protein
MARNCKCAARAAAAFRGDKRAWWKSSEVRSLKNAGAVPLRSWGPDGSRGGRPIDVKSRRVDDEGRYRLERGNHERMVRNNGSYIFNDNGKRIEVPARRVDAQLRERNRNWSHDRRPGGYDYPHCFVYPRDVREMRRR